MLRKLLLLILALIAIGVALFSYSKYYARKDVGEMLDNTRLSASVKTALALNRQLKNARIDVSVSDGALTLTGAVGTAIQKELAEEIAQSIRGVQSLQNNLKIDKVLSVMPVENERTLGERLDDLTIEASVKTALMLNENIRARDISVKSYRGEVSLSGLAHSAAEFELARKIADDVEGVISVKNTLTLSGGGVDSGETEPEKLDDSTIEAQVRAALMVNRNIDYTEIEVASREGVVTLSGMVRSGAEKDLVERIAESCWGVKKVANEVRIRQDT